MLDKARVWHSGLSTAGKVTLWGVTAIVGGSAINVMASPIPSTPPKADPPALVQQDPPKPVITAETLSETTPVVFAKTTVNDGNLASGNTAIRTVGVNGVKTSTYEVTAIGTKVAYVAPRPSSNCDPNYTPCIPNVSYDLDCPDIGQRVTVIGTDHHRLDADHDGTGCDSY